MNDNVKPANEKIAKAIQKDLSVPDPPKHSKAMEQLIINSGVFDEQRATDDYTEGN